ncbi:MAG TPA: putative quinol monooxygenase [Pseudonocardia sp.]
MTTSPDSTQLTIVATMKAKSGKREDLRAALETLLEPTRAEDGNVQYDLHQGIDDPDVFVFYEIWSSAEQLGQHMQSPHLQKALGGLPEMVDGELSLVQLRRIG